MPIKKQQNEMGIVVPGSILSNFTETIDVQYIEIFNSKTKQQLHKYGPFFSSTEVIEFAAVHNISLVECIKTE